MYSLLTFLFVIALISVAASRYRVPPFLALFTGAVLFGLATGMPLSRLVLAATEGMGKVFALLGIVILAGAVIAKLMQEQRHVERVVADLRAITEKPFPLAGAAGYLLAIPLMCCITAFVVLHPIVAGLAGSERERKGLLYTTALGSLVAFALVYPTPVIVALFAVLPESAVNPLIFNLFMVPVSLVLLGGTTVLLHRRFSGGGPGGSPEHRDRAYGGSGSRSAAWAPFLVMAAVFLAGAFLPGLTPTVLVQLALLGGVIAAFILAPAPVRTAGFTAGAKHAGVIIFDLCGAGALGAVIGASPLGSEAHALLSPYFSPLLLPFILAMLVQTAQGSRVVTAVITGGIVAGSGVTAAISPIPLILLISGGACIVSYVTDPYFWLVREATGDDVALVVRHYTVPLAAAGIVMAGIGIVLEMVVF